ncbi:LSU ribosomal protein L15p (L27Ae) [Mariniradius saccharolyticus AK6]|uniref:50S ribosomal protein L15 n=2 Tax=Mariniradius TaxID=1245590 RepID=M7X702_9BACT|nr:LSU ribosomal protein L15p (L27Ae) [Mariniradius saccharolyticus AK6]
MPLQRRIPKFGFNNKNKVYNKPINLDVLQDLASQYNLEVITFDSLVEHGLVGKKDVVKVLGRGELTAKVSVSAHSFSASAVEAIEKVGGTVNKI